MDSVVLSAGVAVISALITASVTSWIAERAKVSDELRELRLRVYPVVWNETSTFSRWPRTGATCVDLRGFHAALRKWYYEDGGLYLSENSRARYGELQELAEAHLGTRGIALTEDLPGTAYEDLMESCSAFRTSLTEDLESRRQRSVLWTLSRVRLHRQQRRLAKQRLRAAGAADSGASRPLPHSARRFGE